MAFVYSGAGSLDYSPCRYGMSKLIFRGPKQALDWPYTVVLGGTETYGKFVAQPYPSVLAQKTGRLVVNLGYVNAGPDAYLNDPGTLAIAAGSEVAIVQLIGAANVSNRFYTVHPRRNDRFVMATPWLRALFPEVDFTEFHFTGHLVQTLHHVSPKRFALVAAELRAVWLDRMRRLLGRLSGKVVLLWMADQPPPPRRTRAGAIGAAASGRCQDDRRIAQRRRRLCGICDQPCRRDRTGDPQGFRSAGGTCRPRYAGAFGACRGRSGPRGCLETADAYEVKKGHPRRDALDRQNRSLRIRAFPKAPARR